MVPLRVGFLVLFLGSYSMQRALNEARAPPAPNERADTFTRPGLLVFHRVRRRPPPTVHVGNGRLVC